MKNNINFWDRYYEICKRNWVTPNFVAKQLGISSGTVTFWKKGKIPYKSTIEKIANYFNVPIAYFYSDKGIDYQSNVSDSNSVNNGKIVRNTNIDKEHNAESLTEFENELLTMFRKMSTKQKNALLTRAYEIMDEQ